MKFSWNMHKAFPMYFIEREFFMRGEFHFNGFLYNRIIEII